jgi:hypothetical protein
MQGRDDSGFVVRSFEAWGTRMQLATRPELHRVFADHDLYGRYWKTTVT